MDDASPIRSGAIMVDVKSDIHPTVRNRCLDKRFQIDTGADVGWVELATPIGEAQIDGNRFAQRHPTATVDRA